jgi:hypothetical protein
MQTVIDDERLANRLINVFGEAKCIAADLVDFDASKPLTHRQLEAASERMCGLKNILLSLDPPDLCKVPESVRVELEKVAHVVQECFRICRPFHGVASLLVKSDLLAIGSRGLDALVVARPMFPWANPRQVPAGVKRPCAERDHTFLAWSEDGMKPAAIRDRWNKEHPKEHVGDGGPGRDIVKKGIRAAQQDQTAS